MPEHLGTLYHPDGTVSIITDESPREDLLAVIHQLLLEIDRLRDTNARTMQLLGVRP